MVPLKLNKGRKSVLVVILFLFFVSFIPLNAQWARTYGGSENDEARCVQQTSDGGYIVVGETQSFGAEAGDIWILKLDNDGTIEWQYYYGESSSIDAKSIRQTSDGGYIVTGSIDDTYPLMLKLSADGSIEWDYHYEGYNGYNDNTFYSIQQISDNGYIMAGYIYDYSFKHPIAQSTSYTLRSSDNNVTVEVDSKFGGAITFLNDKRIDNNNIIDNSNSGTLFQTAIWTLPLSSLQTQLCHDYQKIDGNCPGALPFENPTQGGFYGDGLAGNPIGIRGFYGGWTEADNNEYITKQGNKIELKSRMVNYNYAYAPRQYTTCGDTFESCEDKISPVIDMTEFNQELWETDFYIEQEIKFNLTVGDVIEIDTTILYKGSSSITLQENQVPVLFARGIFHPDPSYQGPYTRGAYRSGTQNVIFNLGSTRQEFVVGYDTAGSRTENWIAILKGSEDKGIGMAVFNYEPISNFGGNYFDYIIDNWPAIFARQPDLEKFLTSGITNVGNNNWLIQPNGWFKVKTFIATGSVKEIRSKLLSAQSAANQSPIANIETLKSRLEQAKKRKIF